MSKSKIKTINYKADTYHGRVDLTFRVPVEGLRRPVTIDGEQVVRLSESQSRRLRSALCGVSGCTCGGRVEQTYTDWRYDGCWSGREYLVRPEVA